MIINFLIGLLYYLVIRIPSLLSTDIRALARPSYQGLYSAPQILKSLNTYRELFGVPDIALYASALNHVFGL